MIVKHHLVIITEYLSRKFLANFNPRTIVKRENEQNIHSNKGKELKIQRNPKLKQFFVSLF